MDDDSGRVSIPPFPPEYRGSGVLLHVASLPSPYGIGDVGPAALARIDRLHEAEQSWWQALPLGPTVYGNSPYQSLSSFAGNELLTGPDGLIEDGLLRVRDCEGNSAALARARDELVGQIDQVRFAQFLLFRLAERLKEHARARGLRLIGDLPFFASPDSSDVWANPELFLFEEQHRPRFVAGVPPDYFSARGQLWGNPVYDWDAIRRTGYRWCIDRLRALLTFVDAVRLDHFRGFAAAWHVPAGAATAQSGQWVPGPGAEFFSAVQRELGGLPFIAEDLGLITPDVYALRDQFRLPGTRVLQFAFDGHSDNPYLPENYLSNTVVFTGSMTIPRHASGTRNCPTPSGAFFGAT
jgi:4-alpha-glucanotransferase